MRNLASVTQGGTVTDEVTLAFFEQTFESAFDIIDRASFESRLTRQLEGVLSDEDTAWYALRNVVYAFGCRASTFKEREPNTWPVAQSKAWRFFENALAVHTELVYFRSNVSAVQALLVMVSCSEYHQGQDVYVLNIVTFRRRHGESEVRVHAHQHNGAASAVQGPSFAAGPQVAAAFV